MEGLVEGVVFIDSVLSVLRRRGLLVGSLVGLCLLLSFANLVFLTLLLSGVSCPVSDRNNSSCGCPVLGGDSTTVPGSEVTTAAVSSVPAAFELPPTSGLSISSRCCSWSTRQLQRVCASSFPSPIYSNRYLYALDVFRLHNTSKMLYINFNVVHCKLFDASCVSKCYLRDRDAFAVLGRQRDAFLSRFSP